MQVLKKEIDKSIEFIENTNSSHVSNLVYQQRFYMLMKLIRVSKMISNAKIVRSPKMN